MEIGEVARGVVVLNVWGAMGKSLNFPEIQPQVAEIDFNDARGAIGDLVWTSNPVALPCQTAVEVSLASGFAGQATGIRCW